MKLVNDGNRTYVSGIASGLDTSALVEAAYQAKLNPIDKIEININDNINKKNAYNEISSNLKDIQDSVSYFTSRTVNIFNQNETTLYTPNISDIGAVEFTGNPKGTFNNLNIHWPILSLGTPFLELLKWPRLT